MVVMLHVELALVERGGEVVVVDLGGGCHWCGVVEDVYAVYVLVHRLGGRGVRGRVVGQGRFRLLALSRWLGGRRRGRRVRLAAAPGAVLGVFCEEAHLFAYPLYLAAG